MYISASENTVSIWLDEFHWKSFGLTNTIKLMVSLTKPLYWWPKVETATRSASGENRATPGSQVRFLASQPSIQAVLRAKGGRVQGWGGFRSSATGPSTGESLATATPKKGFFCRVLASLWLMFWGLIGIPNKYCFTYMLRSRAGTVRPCRFPKTQQWVTWKFWSRSHSDKGSSNLSQRRDTSWQVLRTLCSLRKFKKERT